MCSSLAGVEDVELESFRVPAASPATVAIAGLQPSNMYEFQARKCFGRKAPAASLQTL